MGKTEPARIDREDLVSGAFIASLAPPILLACLAVVDVLAHWSLARDGVSTVFALPLVYVLALILPTYPLTLAITRFVGIPLVLLYQRLTGRTRFFDMLALGAAAGVVVLLALLTLVSSRWLAGLGQVRAADLLNGSFLVWPVCGAATAGALWWVCSDTRHVLSAP